MKANQTKGRKTGAEKRSISASTELFEAADEAKRRRQMGTFSEYVRALIRADLNEDKKAA